MIHWFGIFQTIEFSVFIRFDKGHCVFECVFSYFETDESSGDVVDGWVNPTPDAREAALVGSVLVGSPLQG